LSGFHIDSPTEKVALSVADRFEADFWQKLSGLFVVLALVVQMSRTVVTLE
jgi:hypothetical protein